MIRYLLSDLATPSHLGLLKEQVSQPHTWVSFGLALEQCAQTSEKKLDLNDLFDKLSFDPFKKLLFSIPLFSGTKEEPSKQGKERERKVFKERKEN